MQRRRSSAPATGVPLEPIAYGRKPRVDAAGPSDRMTVETWEEP